MEMLHYDFMQRAFLSSGLTALLASVLGVYLMLRRQALMADMLSHVSLAGVAAGALLGVNPAWSGFAVAMVGAVAVEYVRRAYKTYSEISIAIIMIGGLSSAVVLMSLNKTLNKSLSSYLFGSVLAINNSELLMLGVAAIAGAIFFFILRRPLYQITFDEDTAKTNGLPVDLISFLFSVMTGMIVASAMPVVGVLLVSALIVLPAALAIQIAPSFHTAIGFSMLFGLTGSWTGLAASYQAGTPPGGTIALVLLLYLLTGIGIRKLILKIIKNKKFQHSGG